MPRGPRVTLVGLSEHVRPLEGETDAPNPIVPVKPPNAVAVMVTGDAFPPVKVTVVGLAAREKSCNVYVTKAWCEIEPLTPWTVTVYEPAAPLHPRMEDALVPRTIVEGDSVQVMPLEGETFALRRTVPVNPFTEPTVTVDDPPVGPAIAVTVDGLADTEKSCTLKLTVTVCVKGPLVPVTVDW